MNICTIPHCGNKHLARGWCAKHYQRWKHHGDPLAGRLSPIQNVSERLPKRSKANLITGCIEWQGAYGHNGYGLTKYEKKMVGTHRLAWILAFGPIPEGMCVLHRCDNRKCTNVDHLFLGTIQDNIIDKTHKDRQAKGSKNGNAKLSAPKVKMIRKLHRTGRYTYAQLADRYRMHRTTISDIANRKIWNHVR